MKNLFYLLCIVFFLLSCETKKLPEQSKVSDTTDNQIVNTKLKENTNTTNLFLNPVMGKEYQFESQLTQKIVQRMDTLSSETKHYQTIKYSLKPISKDANGVWTFVAKFNEIEQNISSQMLNVQASTKKLSKEPTPLELFYSTLIGKEFRFKVDERGRNLELIGVDTLLDNVIEKLLKRKEFKGVDKGLLQQIVGSFFNATELKKSFEKLFEIYPEKNLELGESWKISKKANEPIPADIINTFTLKLVKDDSIFIDLVSNILFEKQKSKENEPKLIDLSGKQTGKLIVHRVTGLLLNSKLQQQIKFVYQIPPSQQTNNKTINFSTNVNSTFNLTLK